MSEFGSVAAFEYVILVDRIGKGGCDIVHDGVTSQFKPGQTERPVPQFLAEWLWRVDQQKIHTRDGQYIQRFGLKDASPDLIARIGTSALDCSPIEVVINR